MWLESKRITYYLFMKMAQSRVSVTRCQPRHVTACRRSFLHAVAKDEKPGKARADILHTAQSASLQPVERGYLARRQYTEWAGEHSAGQGKGSGVWDQVRRLALQGRGTTQILMRWCCVPAQLLLAMLVFSRDGLRVSPLNRYMPRLSGWNWGHESSIIHGCPRLSTGWQDWSFLFLIK